MMTAKYRILIVDDEDHSRQELAEYLSGKGYDVDEARDGAEAQQRCETISPDFVISDIRMPRLSGDRFILWLRTIDPTVHVVAITGSYAEADAELALRAGATTVMKKPIRLNDLVALIEQSTNAPRP